MLGPPRFNQVEDARWRVLLSATTRRRFRNLAEAAGFVRARVQVAEEVLRVLYEHRGDYGFYILEYEDGEWDLDHGYAAKDKLLPLQAVTKDLIAMRSKMRAATKKLIVFDSTD
jgi:hypothetical protein